MRKILILILLQVYFCSCQRETEQNLSLDGYIVGYDPCTINQHYRIGYIIISEDLQDTLLSYNISDQNYKMPGSILSDKSDTIYRISEKYFENFVQTPFFPDSLRYKYGITIFYHLSDKDELTINGCFTNILFLSFDQISIESIFKKTHE